MIGPEVGVSSARLETWTGEAFGGGHGTACRVVIDYVGINAAAGGAKAPPSLVMKTSPGNLRRLVGMMAGGQNREVFFHRRFGAELRAILGDVLHGTSDPSGFVLLSEEVKGTPLHRYLGAQLEFFGLEAPPEAREVQQTKRGPVDALKEAFSAAAVLHASHWNDSTLKEIPWLKGAAWYRGGDRASWEQGMALTQRQWRKVKQLHSEEVLGFELSAKLSRIIDASFARSTWEAFQATISDPSQPFALIHGDFHAQNMLWRAQTGDSHGTVCMFDWSEVGPGGPLTELGQMMISDVHPEVWREHDAKLVRCYWEQLVERGVDRAEFPFEACWSLYETEGVQKWIWLFPIMFMFAPASMMVYFQNQLEAFIVDHGDYDSYEIHSSMLLLM